MRVLHAAKLADGQTLAFKLQLLFAHLIAFTGFKALGSILMCGGHDAVAGDVFLGGLIKPGCISD